MPEIPNVEGLLDDMAQELKEQLKAKQISDPAMIGIQTGGVWVAQALHEKLHLKQPLGKLNITFYRDDFTRIGMHPQVQPSSLPFDIDDRHIILVDDVLQTGRTIRAALNEIFDYGRPASVILVAMVVRNGRELPICADIIGESLSLTEQQHIKLSGPEPLKLELQEGK